MGFNLNVNIISQNHEDLSKDEGAEMQTNYVLVVDFVLN
jgi:hypothetical protein